MFRKDTVRGGRNPEVRGSSAPPPVSLPRGWGRRGHAWHRWVQRDESARRGRGGSRVIDARSRSIARRPERRAHLITTVRIEARGAGANGYTKHPGDPHRLRARLAWVGIGQP